MSPVRISIGTILWLFLFWPFSSFGAIPPLAAEVFQKYSAGGFADLQTLLEKAALKPEKLTVARALELMKKDRRFESLFSEYTLARSSLSLQTATSREPRVLLFGETGRLMVTFNSKGSAKGYEALETVEFDPLDKRLKFREIIFKNELRPHQLKLLNGGNFRDLPPKVLDNNFSFAASDIAVENNQFLVTTPNTAKCLQCHQTSERFHHIAKYNWEGYAFWKDFYGESNDALLDDSGRGNPSEPVAAYQDYLNFTEKNPRYATLKRDKKRAYPYRLERELAEYSKRPNLRLTKLMGIYQGEVFADLMEAFLPPSELKTYMVDHFCSGEISKLGNYVEAIFPAHLTLFGEPSEEAQRGARELGWAPVYALGGAPLFFKDVDEYIKMDFKYMVSSILFSNELRKVEPTATMVNRLIRNNMSNDKRVEFSGTPEAFIDLLNRYYDFAEGSKVVRDAFCKVLKN